MQTKFDTIQATQFYINKLKKLQIPSERTDTNFQRQDVDKNDWLIVPVVTDMANTNDTKVKCANKVRTKHPVFC